VTSVQNRVPAEVFLWHPQQRQLHGNTPTKQRKSRNFKSLNVIMSTKLELLITDIIVRSYSKCSNCCPFTRTHARRRLLHSSITSSTTLCCKQRLIEVWSGPDLYQALLQLIHIFHRLLVYMMLYTATNAVVDRVEVGAVGRPEIRRDERWCLTTQKINRRTCPTNGEDVSGPCPSKGTAV